MLIVTGEFKIPPFGIIMFFERNNEECNIMKEVAEELKKKRVKIIPINISKNEDMATYFGLSTVPTFIAMKEGKEVDRLEGVVHPDKIEKIFKKCLG